MFTTKSLSYKLASPTLADLTRAKKVLRYKKGTHELNLYLAIPALKPNDLNKTLKHITGYSDADWAGDPVTRKSTSCTLCYIGQFLLTSECPGQGTVALSSRESEMYALGAQSAELIFAQAILKEIGLSFLIHARADSSTARAMATKEGACRKMKHIHTRFLFIQDLVFRKALTMSSVKTGVNPSDIGTKALGRERFPVSRLGVCVGARTTNQLLTRSQSTLPCVGRANARDPHTRDTRKVTTGTKRRFPQRWAGQRRAAPTTALSPRRVKRDKHASDYTHLPHAQYNETENV